MSLLSLCIFINSYTNLYLIFANVQEKLRQTRKYYGTYNALLEIKELMLKETSLLNSISSQVQVQQVGGTYFIFYAKFF